MGLFCVSMHIRDVEEQALEAALRNKQLSDYRVLPVSGRWTSLYESRASEQDTDWITKLTGELSGELGATAIALMVHDSDIACYWLFDQGKQLDEYNSSPDYFDAEAAELAVPAGGRPRILIRYCREGVSQDELASILQENVTFADDIIEKLAEALGIDPARALGDYRHGGDDGTNENFGDGGNEDALGSFAGVSQLQQQIASRVAQAFGTDRTDVSTDPKAVALVEAAAQGDVEDITQLLDSGTPVDVKAPGPLPAGQPMAGLGKLFPGGVPKMVTTPLLAAVTNKQTTAAELLLNAGANPNRVHPLFGTAIHAAAAAGDAELLKLIIDHGGEVNATNGQGQTPLQVLANSLAALDRLAQAQALMESMGHKIPGLFDQLSSANLPKEGWDLCDQMLKAHGAK